MSLEPAIPSLRWPLTTFEESQSGNIGTYEQHETAKERVVTCCVAYATRLYRDAKYETHITIFHIQHVYRDSLEDADVSG